MTNPRLTGPDDSWRSAPLRQGDAPTQTAAAALRTVGPILLVRHGGEPARYQPVADATPADVRGFLALYMVRTGKARWSGEHDAGICRAGEVLLLDAARSFTIADDHDLDSLVVLAPRSYLLPMVDTFPGTGVYPANGSFGALHRLVEQLLAAAPTAFEGKSGLLAAALRHLIAAALVAIGQRDQVRTGRQHGLLDRCLAAIDERPREQLGITELCRILGSSRSSLYRAAVPLGGVAEMVVRRKLSNVHRALHDPSDPRPIALIAQENGFVRPAQFSHRFKRTFGATAGTIRASARLTAQNAPAIDASSAHFRTYLDVFGIDAALLDRME